MSSLWEGEITCFSSCTICKNSKVFSSNQAGIMSIKKHRKKETTMIDISSLAREAVQGSFVIAGMLFAEMGMIIFRSGLLTLFTFVSTIGDLISQNKVESWKIHWFIRHAILSGGAIYITQWLLKLIWLSLLIRKPEMRMSFFLFLPQILTFFQSEYRICLHQALPVRKEGGKTMRNLKMTPMMGRNEEKFYQAYAWAVYARRPY